MTDPDAPRCVYCGRRLARVVCACAAELCRACERQAPHATCAWAVWDDELEGGPLEMIEMEGP